MNEAQMKHYDDLQKTLLQAKSVFFALEHVTAGQAIDRERGPALAALGGELIEQAEQHIEAVFREGKEQREEA